MQWQQGLESKSLRAARAAEVFLPGSKRLKHTPLHSMGSSILSRRSAPVRLMGPITQALSLAGADLNLMGIVHGQGALLQCQ